MALRINGITISTDPARGWKLLFDGSDRDAPTSIRRTPLVIPGRAGSVPLGMRPVHDERPISFSWRVSGITRAAAEAASTDLVSLLAAPTLTLSRDWNGRIVEASAELVSVAVPEWDKSGRGVVITAVLQLTDPFWRDEAWAQTTIAAGAPAVVPTLAGRSAPTTDAVLRVPAATTTFSLTDQATATGVSWDGAAGAGYIYLDCSTLRAWRAASDSAWTFQGTEVTAGIDYPNAGPLVLTPVGLPTAVTVTAVDAAVTIRARGSYL